MSYLFQIFIALMKEALSGYSICDHISRSQRLTLNPPAIKAKSLQRSKSSINHLITTIHSLDHPNTEISIHQPHLTRFPQHQKCILVIHAYYMAVIILIDQSQHLKAQFASSVAFARCPRVPAFLAVPRAALEELNLPENMQSR